jgi:hypothetical protein
MAAPQRVKRQSITSARDELMLQALASYWHLTAKQIAKLLYGNSENFVSQRLAEFCHGGLLARQELSVPRLKGNRPYVYRLDTKGRRYLEAIGFELPPRSHHSPQTPYAFQGLDHTLCVNDFLIDLELLCREHRELQIARWIHERSFARDYDRVEVQVGDGPVQKIPVCPDAWIDLRAITGRCCLSLEVDMGTHGRGSWQEKIRGLVAWMHGRYEERFGTKNLTIVVVAIPGPKRRLELQEWTAAELKRLKSEHLATLFCFTDVHPGTVPPTTFFLAPVWHSLVSSERTPLFQI